MSDDTMMNDGATPMPEGEEQKPEEGGDMGGDAAM